MNHTPGATAGDGGTFSPEQAAALLGQAIQQARRKFQPSPPWLLVTRAVMVLAALGATLAVGAWTASLPGPDGRRHPGPGCLRCRQLCRNGRCPQAGDRRGWRRRHRLAAAGLMACHE
jgi:hypothetical protein